MVVDGLASNGPHIKHLKAMHLRFLLVGRAQAGVAGVGSIWLTHLYRAPCTAHGKDGLTSPAAMLGYGRGKSAPEWFGGCSDGLASGEGILSWASGTVAEGPFVDGKAHSQWTERKADGAVWEGSYVDDGRHGQWTGRFAAGSCKVLEWSREEVGRSSC